MRNHNYHIENEKLFFTRTQPYSIPKPIRSGTMGRWVRGGDKIFVKKRYGKTRVGGFLFSVRVELPFFIPYAFWWNMSFSALSLFTWLLFETFRVQSPASRVQNPESSVQSPESSVQLLRPESRNSCMPLRYYNYGYDKIKCLFVLFWKFSINFTLWNFRQPI